MGDIEHSEVTRLAFVAELEEMTDLDLVLAFRGNTVNVWAKQGVPVPVLVQILRRAADEFEAGDVMRTR